MTKSRFGRIVKLSTKTREALTQEVSQNNSSPTAGTEVKNLILYLTKLLNNWDVEKNNGERDIEVWENLESSNQEEDLIMILATKINSVNTTDYDQFICTMQFDIEKPETYARAMQSLYIAP